MANYVLDKGFPVLSTYNSSGGVVAFRAVKWSSTGIDVQATATAGNAVLGVVQEDVDAVKVTYGKVVADVRILGITKMKVAASGTAPAVGDPVVVSTGGTVVKGVTSTNVKVGIVVGPTGQTIANGDLIDVLLTPGQAI